MRDRAEERGSPREPGRERPYGMDERLVSFLAPASFEAEQYRALRYFVEHMRRTAGLSIVAVSSSIAGEGKTTTAVNLAGALAQAPDARILLVDADLRRPAVALHGPPVSMQLGLGDSADLGLADAVLNPALSLGEVVRLYPTFNLAVLAAGRYSATPYEVIKSPRLGELLGEARQRYDYVVVDTPPLVPVPDCRVMAKWVDGFIVVVAANKTPRKLFEEALNLMEPSKVIGLVFNGDDRPRSRYYGSYHGYYHYSRGASGEGRARLWSWLGKKADRSSPYESGPPGKDPVSRR